MASSCMVASVRGGAPMVFVMVGGVMGVRVGGVLC